MAEGRSTQLRGERSLHRWAFATACGAFLLVAAGGLVTSRDAGLAVPDWPLSYGTLNPPRWYEVENVRTEHGHRLIAGLVALLTLATAWHALRRKQRREVRLLALACAFTVLLQALLGGLRVLHLSVDLAMVHGWLGQIFVALLVALTAVTSRHWHAPSSPPPPRFAPAAAIGAVAVIGQLVLGIALRHGGDEIRPLAEHGLFWAHVGTAAALLALALYMPLLAGASEPHNSYLLRRTRLLRTLVLLQIALGVGAWLLTEQPRVAESALAIARAWIPTLHVLVGAGVLATTVVLVLHSWVPRADTHVSVAPASTVKAG